jgi:hypothetical protein
LILCALMNLISAPFINLSISMLLRKISSYNGFKLYASKDIKMQRC